MIKIYYKILVYVWLTLLTTISPIAKAENSLKQDPPLFTQNFSENFKPIKLKLTGDFVKALKQKRAEDPNTEVVEDKIFVPGTLVNTDGGPRTFGIKMKARGNSVLSDTEEGDENDSATSQEVDFPKLKIEINDDESLKNTLFTNARNFRINTHLFNKSQKEHTVQGRLIGDRGPWREGMAYKVAEILELLAPKTSLAEITYTCEK